MFLLKVVLVCLITINFRAICGRIEETLQGLPPPFLLNRPSMYKITSMEVRQPQKAPNFAVIWGVGMDQPEIVNTTIGKPEEGMSIISKQNFGSRFGRLYQSLPPANQRRGQIGTYMEAKEKAFEYTVRNIYTMENQTKLRNIIF